MGGIQTSINPSDFGWLPGLVTWLPAIVRGGPSYDFFVEALETWSKRSVFGEEGRTVPGDEGMDVGKQSIVLGGAWNHGMDDDFPIILGRIILTDELNRTP